MFVYHHRVRNHEVDAQGFVFNSRYLEIADVALTEWLRSLGWPYPALLAAGVDPSVVHADIAFRSPARLDDVLDVEVRCSHVGRTSFRLAVRVRRAGADLAALELAYVNVDIHAATSVPLPDEIASAMRAVVAP